MAATTYRPRAWTRTAIPSARTLHGLQRFTAGYTPELHRQVVTAGGFERWLERQLAQRDDDGWYRTTARWWPSVTASHVTIAKRSASGVQEFWEADADYERWVIARRYGSRRQVLETMTEVWEHHLNVPAVGEVGPFRAAYGVAIRQHALGRFADLLQAAIVHPAMSIYLGNANSSKSAPNENLGRELLELHTVGRGNYTEDDVKSSARILTGYRVDLWKSWNPSYAPAHHWTGPVKVMGFQHANAAANGQPVVRAYLNYLARHPATAQRIATLLARRFVSDDPPAALVRRLAATYQAHDTAIVPVLRALAASPEFRSSSVWGTKVRTPSEDVIATWRALVVSINSTKATATSQAAVDDVLWQTQSLGLRPFGWQPPDGRPDNAAAWSSTSRFLNGLSVHYSMAGASWPKVGIAYRKPASWLPASRLRFDELVDHLARTLHGRPSTAVLLRAACEATGLAPATRIDAQHSLVRWEMARLLTVFLDCPNHMSR